MATKAFYTPSRKMRQVTRERQLGSRPVSQGFETCILAGCSRRFSGESSAVRNFGLLFGGVIPASRSGVGLLLAKECGHAPGTPALHTDSSRDTVPESHRGSSQPHWTYSQHTGKLTKYPRDFPPLAKSLWQKASGRRKIGFSAARRVGGSALLIGGCRGVYLCAVLACMKGWEGQPC